MKRLETADDQPVTIAAYHIAEQSSTPPVEKKKNAEPADYELRNILALPTKEQDPASFRG